MLCNIRLRCSQGEFQMGGDLGPWFDCSRGRVRPNRIFFFSFYFTKHRRRRKMDRKEEQKEKENFDGSVTAT